MKYNELTEQLRRARGQEWVKLRARVFELIEKNLRADIEKIKTCRLPDNPKILDLLHLCIKYDVPFKTLMEWLEEQNIIPTGVHDDLIDRGMKPKEALEKARETYPQSIIYPLVGRD